MFFVVFLLLLNGLLWYGSAASYYRFNDASYDCASVSSIQNLLQAELVDHDCFSKVNAAIFKESSKHENLALFLRFPIAALKLKGFYSLIPEEIHKEFSISSPYTPHPQLFHGVCNLDSIHASIFEFIMLQDIKSPLDLNADQLKSLTRVGSIEIVFGRLCFALSAEAVLGIPVEESHPLASNAFFEACKQSKIARQQSGSIFLIRPTTVGYVFLLVEIIAKPASSPLFFLSKHAWGNTGGMMENNETSLQAAIRETREETNGLISLDLGKVNPLHSYYNNKENHVMYFLVQPLLENYRNSLYASLYDATKQINANTEIRDYSWASLEDFLEFLSLSNNNNDDDATSTATLRVLKDDQEAFQEEKKSFYLRECFLNSSKSLQSIKLIKEVLIKSPNVYFEVFTTLFPFDKEKEFPNLLNSLTNLIQSAMLSTFANLLKSLTDSFDSLSLMKSALDIKGPFVTALLAYVYDKAVVLKESFNVEKVLIDLIQSKEKVTLDEISLKTTFSISPSTPNQLKKELKAKNRKLKLLGFEFLEEEERKESSPVLLHQQSLLSIHKELEISFQTQSFRCRGGKYKSPRATLFILQTAFDLPFLSIHESCLDVWETSLEILNSNSRKHLHLFRKLLFTSRFKFNNNQIYRSSSSNDRFLKLIRLSSAKLKFNIVPELVPSVPIVPNDEITAFNSFSSLLYKQLSEYFISAELFIKEFTHEGVLYHGTCEYQNVFSMKRNGFILSRTESFLAFSQGNASFGSGLYASKERETALFYKNSGTCGVVLSLQLKLPSTISILNMELIPFALSQQLHQLHFVNNGSNNNFNDINSFLASMFAIDIIINSHVILQNTQCISKISIERESENEIGDGYFNWRHSLKLLGHPMVDLLGEFSLPQIASSLLSSNGLLRTEHFRLVFINKLIQECPVCISFIVEETFSSAKHCFDTLLSSVSPSDFPIIFEAALDKYLQEKGLNAKKTLSLLALMQSNISVYFQPRILPALRRYSLKYEIIFYKVAEFLSLVLEILPGVVESVARVFLDIDRFWSEKKLLFPKKFLECYRKFGTGKLFYYNNNSKSNSAAIHFVYLDLQSNAIDYRIDLLADFTEHPLFYQAISHTVVENLLCNACIPTKVEHSNSLLKLLKFTQMSEICPGYWSCLQKTQEKQSLFSLLEVRIHPKYLNGSEAMEILTQLQKKETGNDSSLFVVTLRMIESLLYNSKHFNTPQIITILSFLLLLQNRQSLLSFLYREEMNFLSFLLRIIEMLLLHKLTELHACLEEYQVLAHEIQQVLTVTLLMDDDDKSKELIPSELSRNYALLHNTLDTLSNIPYKTASFETILDGITRAFSHSFNHRRFLSTHLIYLYEESFSNFSVSFASSFASSSFSFAFHLYLHAKRIIELPKIERATTSFVNFRGLDTAKIVLVLDALFELVQGEPKQLLTEFEYLFALEDLPSVAEALLQSKHSKALQAFLLSIITETAQPMMELLALKYSNESELLTFVENLLESISKKGEKMTKEDIIKLLFADIFLNYCTWSKQSINLASRDENIYQSSTYEYFMEQIVYFN